MKKLLFLLTTCVIFLASCIPPTQELESLAVINARGVDRLDNGDIETTLLVYRFDQQTPQNFTTVSGVGRTIKGAREIAANNINFRASPGQINTEIYGYETAERGILHFMNGLVRDSRVSDTMNIAISTESAKNILTEENSTNMDIGNFLESLINKEVDEGTLPSASLYTFSNTYGTPGHDPVLPLLDTMDGRPNLIGIGYFQKDRIVASGDMTEATILNTLKTTIKNTPLEITVPIEPFVDSIYHPDGSDKSELTVELTVVKGKSNIKLLDINQPLFEVNTKIRADINETSIIMAFSEEKTIHRLEAEIEKKLVSLLNGILDKSKEHLIDPIGFGRYYRINKPSGLLTDEEWKEILPDIQVDFNIDIDIENYGTIM